MTITGQHTGRSASDKFIVKDANSEQIGELWVGAAALQGDLHVPLTGGWNVEGVGRTEAVHLAREGTLWRP